jgi:hypothetical protein
MSNTDAQKSEPLENSSPVIPAIVIPIPSRYRKERNFSTDQKNQEKIETNETRAQSRKTTLNEVILLKKSHISPIPTKKTLKSNKRARKGSASLARSFNESRSKAKVVKCDLKKGIFSSKQNVFMENNTAKTFENKEKRSVSPVLKGKPVKKHDCQLLENFKMMKENIEDRRKNWRMAMREFAD